MHASYISVSTFSSRILVVVKSKNGIRRLPPSRKKNSRTEVSKSWLLPALGLAKCISVYLSFAALLRTIRVDAGSFQRVVLAIHNFHIYFRTYIYTLHTYVPTCGLSKRSSALVCSSQSNISTYILTVWSERVNGNERWEEGERETERNE